MRGWRLCRAPFADLSGEGARRFGGRWNAPGRAMVYLAADAALCVLEVRVHLDLPLTALPDDYVLIAVNLPGPDPETLPAIPQSPAEFGDIWLQQRRSAVLRVPSTIVAESTNLLFNPAHPAATAARVESTRPFSFDRRLWPNP